ncbi:septal ring lytic transglycosylase RlpA family protein [Sphingomonas pseudosanguinis]|uniref:Endolytic peptidoglycan transglycosylase RlpA n=1 Tax=Sphingomonas pseudosanguinis TaxID=413712 RepID=A0A7W6A9H3_9SPHN|nr:septal ring lytic transglycosylase RlpA family protein [Sphingomonas pseudosanguinis]MBB3879677.1 rare lipoprotein A [Sphingomonas pseudosanguinis]MBN3536479.1 septal ring lytic transglycosylase RlpA family protein [Sphingomonas pseudosanguinis]
MRLRVERLAIAALAAMLAVPATAAAPDDAPAARYGSYQATGRASWYGHELAGRRTATGRRFNPDDVMIAHRSLPLDSMVEVTDVDTGRTIVARVGDRGPGRADRVADLSLGAARLLGTNRRAVANIRLRALKAGSDNPGLILAGASAAPPVARPIKLDAAGTYRVQIASFTSQGRAEALARRFDARTQHVGRVWRVERGALDANSAKALRDAAAQAGYDDARVLHQD